MLYFSHVTCCSDLHPQIEDLIEVNWDDRWKQMLHAPPYYTFFEGNDEVSSVPIFMNILLVYMASCVVGIFASLIYLIKLSYQIHTSTFGKELKSSIISSLALLTPFYLVCGGLTCPSIPTTPRVITVANDPCSTLLFVYGTLKRGFQWNQKYLHNRGGRGAVFVSNATTREKHRMVVGDSGVPYLCLNNFLPEDSEECSCIATSSLGNPTDNCTCSCESCQHGIHRPRRSWTGDAAAISLAATSIGASSAVLWGKSTPSFSNRTGLEGERIHGELWRVSPECLRNLDDYEGISKQYYQRKKIAVQLHDARNTLMIADVYCVSFLPDHLTNGPFLEEYTLTYHRECYRPIAHIQVKQLNYIQTISSWGNVQEEKISLKGMKNVKD